MRTHGSAEQLEARRRRAVRMVVEEQIPPAKVASRVGASRRSVDRWVQAYRDRGEEALAAKPHPGAPCRLTGRQRKGLRKRLLKGAQSQGFATDLWTCPRVRQLIAKSWHDRSVRFKLSLLLGLPKLTPVYEIAKRFRDNT